MIVVLPILLYPVAGIGLLQLSAGVGKKQSVVGVSGVENLPHPTPRRAGLPVGPAAAWWGLPLGVFPTPGSRVQRVLAAAAQAQCYSIDPHLDYPPLLLEDDEGWHVSWPYNDIAYETEPILIQPLPGPSSQVRSSEPGDQEENPLADFPFQVDRTPLDQ